MFVTGINNILFDRFKSFLKKKNKPSKESELNDKIVKGMEELLQHVSASEYRLALTDLFFEVAISTQDHSLEFSICAYRIQALSQYFDKLNEKG